MVAYIIAGIVSLSGTYLCFRAETLLDSVIEFQKRLRGGFYWKADLRERCRACGHRDLKNLMYNPEAQRLVVSCPICSAAWPLKPRVPVQGWDFVGAAMKANQDQIANVREVFERANEPVIKKKEVAA